MAFVIQRDWEYYNSKTLESHSERAKRMNPEERFALYSDLYDLIASQQSPDIDLERKKLTWANKLLARNQMVCGFAKLDSLKHGE